MTPTASPLLHEPVPRRHASATPRMKRSLSSIDESEYQRALRVLRNFHRSRSLDIIQEERHAPDDDHDDDTRDEAPTATVRPPFALIRKQVAVPCLKSLAEQAALQELCAPFDPIRPGDSGRPSQMGMGCDCGTERTLLR